MSVCLVASAEAHRGHYTARIKDRQHAYDVARGMYRYVTASRALRGKRYWQRRQRVHYRRTRVLTVRCRGLDREQRRVLRGALREARRRRAPYRARLSLVAAGWVESRLRDLTYGHADSEGFLQLRIGLWGRRTARSVTLSSRAFLTRGFTGRGGAIRLARSGMPSGRIAQAVQGSAFPHRYGAVKAHAARLLRCAT